MKLKEISKDIYDVDAWLDEELGKEGTPEREASIEKAARKLSGKMLESVRIAVQVLISNRINYRP